MYWKTIWIPQILGAVFGGVFVFRLGKSKTPEILLRTMEEFTGMIRESKGYTGWAEKTERKLIRNGAKYHFGKTITPMKYLTGRIVLAFLGAISLLKIGCGYAVLAATVLYFLPELLLIYMNERDNRNMLTEIKLIYQALDPCRYLCRGCSDGMLSECERTAPATGPDRTGGGSCNAV